jgi:hypothetical protein
MGPGWRSRVLSLRLSGSTARVLVHGGFTDAGIAAFTAAPDSTRFQPGVAVCPVDEVALREEGREHAGGEAAEVHIVAPAPHTSRLQRLMGAVDEAHAEAEAGPEKPKSLLRPGSNYPSPSRSVEIATREPGQDGVCAFLRGSVWLQRRERVGSGLTLPLTACSPQVSVACSFRRLLDR